MFGIVSLTVWLGAIARRRASTALKLVSSRGEVTVVSAVDNGDGGNIHGRRAKITLVGAIAGWGDEAMDFDAQPEAGDRTKC